MERKDIKVGGVYRIRNGFSHTVRVLEITARSWNVECITISRKFRLTSARQFLHEIAPEAVARIGLLHAELERINKLPLYEQMEIVEWQQRIALECSQLERGEPVLEPVKLDIAHK